MLNFLIGCFQSSFLPGIGTTNNRASKDKFQIIIKKLQNRLASWKHKYLHRAGRVTLAKSLIASIPVYYMQINWLPRGICN